MYRFIHCWDPKQQAGFPPATTVSVEAHLDSWCRSNCTNLNLITCHVLEGHCCL